MARSKNKNAGVIGLGIIGSRIAATLRKRGLQVFVWNRSPRTEPNFLGSPAEVAELCNVIQIFVSNDEALLETIGLLTGALTAHHIIIAHSTVAPETMRTASQRVERRGARFLEAPFTGSKVAAESGQLVYYIGGDEMALKQARPILEASSKEIIEIGEIGSASVIKVATNIVTAATAEIAAEALAIVRRSGISGEIFSRAMKSNASNSTTLEMKAPMMLAGNFEPHFSVKHMLKDVRIAANLGQQYQLELPMTELAGDMLLAEMKQGRGDADYSSVAQKYFPISSKSSAPPELKSVEIPREEPKPPTSFQLKETEPVTLEPPATRSEETEKTDMAQLEATVAGAENAREAPQEIPEPETTTEVKEPEPNPPAPNLFDEKAAETIGEKADESLGTSKAEEPIEQAQNPEMKAPVLEEEGFGRPEAVIPESIAETMADEQPTIEKGPETMPNEKPAEIVTGADEHAGDSVPPNLSGGIRSWFNRFRRK
jgi:3-hydroxyisobutyrate dehydrogenase-like beta-hydroxyacid dehydrogenase